jgi:uncharacterized protein
MSTRTLRCPNCDGPMREVDRRGLTIDICNECRGIFLDRGELEKLLETVDRWEDAQAAQPYAPGPPPGTHPGPGPGSPPAAPPPPPGTHPGPGPGTLPTAPPGPPPGHYPPGQKGLGGIADILSAVVNESRKHSGRHGYGHYGYGHKKRRKGGLGELFGDLLD